MRVRSQPQSYQLPFYPVPQVDATFLVWFIINKFQWHIPLHRQEQMLKAQGFNISRDTLIRYTIAVAELLKKLYQCEVEECFVSSNLYADETPVTVGKGKKGEKKYSKSYLQALYV